MFLETKKPKDFDCGYNLDLMIAAVPRIEDKEKRLDYVKRIVGLIKQSHISWVNPDGSSPDAWAHFFSLAEYDPRDYGITNPFETGEIDDAR